MSKFVLLCDDEAAITRAAEIKLTRAGFEVVAVAHSGREALHLVERVQPDLVVLDIYLPDVSGLEVLQELRHRRIATMDGANDFLTQHWMDYHNKTFTVRPAEAGTAFMPSTGTDLEKVFSHQEERAVDNDNTIVFDKRVFQIPQQTFRFSLARCRVLVCRHLDRSLSIYYGPHLLVRYREDGAVVKDDLKERKKNQKRKKAAA